jgi:hypothetical protein
MSTSDSIYPHKGIRCPWCPPPKLARPLSGRRIIGLPPAGISRDLGSAPAHGSYFRPERTQTQHAGAARAALWRPCRTRPAIALPAIGTKAVLMPPRMAAMGQPAIGLAADKADEPTRKNGLVWPVVCPCAAPTRKNGRLQLPTVRWCAVGFTMAGYEPG